MYKRGTNRLVYQGLERLLSRHLSVLRLDPDVFALVAVDGAARAVRGRRRGRLGFVLGGALNVEVHGWYFFFVVRFVGKRDVCVQSMEWLVYGKDGCNSWLTLRSEKAILGPFFYKRSARGT